MEAPRQRVAPSVLARSAYQMVFPTVRSILFEIHQHQLGKSGEETLTSNTLTDLTILIVEDEPLIAMSLEDLLSDKGAICLGPVGSIDSALDIIAANRFDIALLDINLRGQKIDPVADRLAAAGIPFIFTTGHGEDGLPLSHRHRPVIAKPYSDTAVIDTLLQCRPHSDPTSADFPG